MWKEEHVVVLDWSSTETLTLRANSKISTFRNNCFGGGKEQGRNWILRLIHSDKQFYLDHVSHLHIISWTACTRLASMPLNKTSTQLLHFLKSTAQLLLLTRQLKPISQISRYRGSSNKIKTVWWKEVLRHAKIFNNIIKKAIITSLTNYLKCDRKTSIMTACLEETWILREKDTLMTISQQR